LKIFLNLLIGITDPELVIISSYHRQLISLFLVTYVICKPEHQKA